MSIEAHNLCKAVMNTCSTNLSKSSCAFDMDGTTTNAASCVAASDTRSSGVQTKSSKYRKLRNKTTTTDIKSVPKIEKKLSQSEGHMCDIHAIITLNVVARRPDDDQRSLSVETSDIKVLTNTSSAKRKESKQRSKCTCTVEECAKTGTCADSCKELCKYGGLGPCNAFSLGSADYRMLLREKCNSMLIGGCRVPICRNFKNKL
ncbi:uncharacterized protein LOC114359285 [Ostrinia furnacalis]|uniref:uncharacterized protein LOC114359285 n=1 Tax=Ostrinia furnacalis TaxID=93504 RepID=UPI00103DFE08|nr:uncharacterized protein LOC114359285 [Ostrinia furnacalis]